MNLTPWYPPTAKPAYIGWYHTSAAPKHYHFTEWWDGANWRASPKEPAYARSSKLHWRGQKDASA